VMGTAQYLSPEQAVGNPATPKSDLYALGVIAYEATAGKRPFSGKSPVDIAIAHVNDPVPPLPRHADPRLAAIIMRLLAKDPADRPENAAVLAAELDALVHPPEPRSFSVPTPVVPSAAAFQPLAAAPQPLGAPQPLRAPQQMAGPALVGGGTRTASASAAASTGTVDPAPPSDSGEYDQVTGYGSRRARRSAMVPPGAAPGLAASVAQVPVRNSIRRPVPPPASRVNNYEPATRHTSPPRFTPTGSSTAPAHAASARQVTPARIVSGYSQGSRPTSLHPTSLPPAGQRMTSPPANSQYVGSQHPASPRPAGQRPTGQRPATASSLPPTPEELTRPKPPSRLAITAVVLGLILILYLIVRHFADATGALGAHLSVETGTIALVAFSYRNRTGKTAGAAANHMRRHRSG